jgi:dTDP-4-dehydrorhamnose 3,5-epimerase
LKFSSTKVPGCYIVDIEPRGDDRGFFARQYCREEFLNQGIDPAIEQINIGLSERAGTLRGMHFQTAPYEDTKFVRCLAGAIFDVCLDLRPASATYLEWVGVELSAANRRSLYLPAGTAHGYLTLADNTEIMYTTNQAYAPDNAAGVRYDDTCFGIRWPREVTTLSPADREWPDFKPECT